MIWRFRIGPPFGTLPAPSGVGSRKRTTSQQAKQALTGVPTSTSWAGWNILSNPIDPRQQSALPFDYRVLLSAPEAVLVERLRTRTSNAYGRDSAERAQVLADLAEVEPLLRRSADLVLTTTAPLPEVADRLIACVAGA